MKGSLDGISPFPGDTPFLYTPRPPSSHANQSYPECKGPEVEALSGGPPSVEQEPGG
ncbi:hypothetical protein ACRRTK_023938 [Alexandromys fortis]